MPFAYYLTNSGRVSHTTSNAVRCKTRLRALKPGQLDPQASTSSKPKPRTLTRVRLGHSKGKECIMTIGDDLLSAARCMTSSSLRTSFKLYGAIAEWPWHPPAM